ncbi:MAG: HIT domain-containing protein [Bryobacteraceae bacterium]|nr:HIT domain-containing protein [Bryobacteraceae bacterium]
MDHLWTPWRYSYITQAKLPAGCIFCEKAASADDERNLIVHRAPLNFVLLNLYPYNNGHVMIAPYAHAATLEQAPEEALVEMIRLARRAEEALTRIYRPKGINLGMNVGECAGAGVAGHIHLHVLPRWPGDVSFMTTTGETRVIPEDLATTWRKLRDAFSGAQ